MNGTAFIVHQSSRRIDRRKLVSKTRSPSVAVVAEIAPRWIMASNLRPLSQSGSSAGGTISTSCRLARLRHLPSVPSRSQTTTSLRPASFSAATTFDPIKPAPPVTSNIPTTCPLFLVPGPAVAHDPPKCKRFWDRRFCRLYLPAGSGYRTANISTSSVLINE
ncbi:hypothetical protein ABIF91_009177 [Bradyrhizobium sp. USDA 241]